MENKSAKKDEHNMGVEIVGDFLIGHPKNVPEQEVDLIMKIVRDAQTKPRCKACYPCPMGVVGCDEDSRPHGHGSSKRCPECGVPYVDIHPHSNVCSLGTPIDSGMMHDEHSLHRQLEWTKGGY
jgi:hypothetical protein